MLCIKIPENISLQSITEIYVHFYKTLLKGCENITIKTTKKWYKKNDRTIGKKKSSFYQERMVCVLVLGMPTHRFFVCHFADSVEV